MDERLEKALEFSNYMTTLNNQRRIIKEQFLENCVHYINGGKFSVNRELITFCQALRHNHQDDAIVIDDNETPIKIDDLQQSLSLSEDDATKKAVEFKISDIKNRMSERSSKISEIQQDLVEKEKDHKEKMVKMEKDMRDHVKNLSSQE